MYFELSRSRLLEQTSHEGVLTVFIVLQITDHTEPITGDTHLLFSFFFFLLQY